MKMVIETSRPIARVAKELGINDGTLGNWVSAYRREHAGEEPPLTVNERTRLRELERETREPHTLAHLPSGSFPANAAWLACAAIAHNLLRAAGSLASLTCAKARAATLRRDLINLAARIARHGRGQITLHLPEGWHRETEWMNLFETACGPPAQAA